MVYVVEADNREAAQDSIALDDIPEFGQAWLGEMIVSSRRIEDAEIVEIHDELNEYLKDWTREQKLARIHKVEA